MNDSPTLNWSSRLPHPRCSSRRAISTATRSSGKEFLAKNSGKQVIMYCRSGGRAGTIANALAAKGINAANAGGLQDWTKAGLPTRKVEEKPSGEKKK